jgi:membrane associated rhomboid family serine protease
MARPSGFSLGSGRPTKAVLAILVVLVGVYFATALGERAFPGVFNALLMDASAVNQGQVWRLLTYGVLHDISSPFHLLMNGLMFYMFGPALEARWGTSRFLGFVAVAVIVGGLFVWVAALLGISTGVALGFSAAVEASIVAWGLLHRDAQVRFMFMIEMRGIHFVWLALFLAVLDAVSFGNISAAAHFGGIAVGVVAGLGLLGRNTRKLWWDAAMVKLRLRKAPKLTVVPRGPDRWVH